VTLVIRYILAK